MAELVDLPSYKMVIVHRLFVDPGMNRFYLNPG